MNVWWCEIHQSRRSQPAFESCQFAVIYPAAASHCRFVDALVIVRDAEGNWPQWALGVLVNILFVGPVPNWDAAALDALAEAARINLQ